jgi:hypothetical protein
MMTTKQHDFGEVLPVGVCATCLAAMVDRERGKPAYTRELPGGGGTVWAIFCEHHNAGACAVVAPSRPIQWRIFVPIEPDELLKLVETVVAFHLGLAAGTPAGI